MKVLQMLFMLLLVTTARGASHDCDRACLAALANQLLDSMAAHAPDSLPLRPQYAATENSVPGALNMMVLWHTGTRINSRFLILDTTSQQAFFEASVAEGPGTAFVYGRIRVESRQLAEIEIFANRARGQGGFQFGPEGPQNFPIEWTQQVDTPRLPQRAQLLQFGRSMFDTSIGAPPVSEDCVLMENGKVVAEHVEVAAKVSGSKPARPGKAFRPNPDGTISIPCGAPKERPTDPKARVPVIDEQQGIVVSMAVVHGMTEPYLATTPTESAFVPTQILAPYLNLLAGQKNPAPALRAMAATAAVAQVERIFDGKLQGMQLLVNLGAPGSHSAWVGE